MGGGSSVPANEVKAEEKSSNDEVSSNQLRKLAIGRTTYKDTQRDYDPTLASIEINKAGNVEWAESKERSEAKSNRKSSYKPPIAANAPRLDQQRAGGAALGRLPENGNKPPPPRRPPPTAQAPPIAHVIHAPLGGPHTPHAAQGPRGAPHNQPVFAPSTLGPVIPAIDKPPLMYANQPKAAPHFPSTSIPPTPSSGTDRLRGAGETPTLGTIVLTADVDDEVSVNIRNTKLAGQPSTPAGLPSTPAGLPSTPGFLRNSANAGAKFTPPPQQTQNSSHQQAHKPDESQSRPEKKAVDAKPAALKGSMRSASKTLFSKLQSGKAGDEEEEDDDDEDDDYNLEPGEVYDWIAMNTAADALSLESSIDSSAAAPALAIGGTKCNARGESTSVQPTPKQPKPSEFASSIPLQDPKLHVVAGEAPNDPPKVLHVRPFGRNSQMQTDIYSTTTSDDANIANFLDTDEIVTDSHRPDIVPPLKLDITATEGVSPNQRNRNFHSTPSNMTSDGVASIGKGIVAAAGLRIGTNIGAESTGGSKFSDSQNGSSDVGTNISTTHGSASPMTTTLSAPKGQQLTGGGARGLQSSLTTPNHGSLLTGGPSGYPNAITPAGQPRGSAARNSNKPIPPPKPAASPHHAVKETTDVKRNRAQLPSNMTHAKPTTGDWLKKRYIVNNYILLDVLGEGSYGEVRLCKDRTTDLLFAIKIISKEMLNKKKNGKSNETYFEDIKREIAIMKKLVHPNVLRLFEVLDDPKINKLYLVLEYMKQGDLVKVLKDREVEEQAAAGTTKMVPTGYTPLSDLEYWNIFQQVTAGMRYLHLQNIVHGDIKPQNLLIREDGVVKIADFGISKMMSASTQKVADAAGTPAFMSPELYNLHDGQSVNGPLADVWALGATMFMLRFGHPPFIASNIGLLGSKIRNDPVVFPQPIDNSLKDLIGNMLIKDPNERFTLKQVLAHPYLRQPPSSAVMRTALTPAVPKTGPVQDDKSKAISAKSSEIKFQPPASYHKEEEEATKAPVPSLSNADMFASIGLGVKKRHVQKTDGQGEDNIEEGEEDEEHDIEEKQEDIMATKWGDGVFEQVDDVDIGTDSEDEARDSVDGSMKSMKSMKRSSAKDLIKGARLGVGSVESKGVSQSQLSSQGSRISEMGKEEEEARLRRFQHQMTKKSLSRLVQRDSEMLTIATSGISSTDCVPSTLTAHCGSLESTGNFGAFANEQNRSQATTPVMNGGTPSRSKKRPSTSSERFGSADGLDEDDEELDTLSMEDFSKMMDTLAQQPLKSEASDCPSPMATSFDVKSLSCGAVNRLNGVGAAFHSEKGVRATQEDRCVLLHDVSQMRALQGFDFDSTTSNEEIMATLKNFSFAGVYDGHSGWMCSQYLSEHLAVELVLHPKFFDKHLDTALTETFCSVDKQICDLLAEEDDNSGATAILAVFDGRRKVLTVASVGDSRCVLSRAGKAVDLVGTHRLSNEKEKHRVIAAGGTIINSRVNGVLAVSRAFGDVQFKDLASISTGLVTAVPEIYSEVITPMTEFAIIASDGLWDVVSPQVAVKFVRNFVAKNGGSLERVSNALAKEALSRGSVDNVTVLVISFHLS